MNHSQHREVIDDLVRMAQELRRLGEAGRQIGDLPPEVGEMVDALASADNPAVRARERVDALVRTSGDGGDARLTSLHEALKHLSDKVSAALTGARAQASAADAPELRDGAAAGGDAPSPTPAQENPEVIPGVPRRLGPFVLTTLLGSGGMGDVYVARQEDLHRDVALKVLPPRIGRKPEALQRFLQEARATAGLNHPGIVSVYSSGIEKGYPYIAMQLVRGISVEELLRQRRPLPANRALAITRDVARALQAAHGADITHRDVKPGNILIEGSAENARREGRVFLVDFGLALLKEAEPLTRTGEILGTPSFMSPEQAMGLKTTSTTDIYSLGATLYAMISGRAPHEGSSYAQVINSVARKSPPPLRLLNPAVDRDIATICEKAMRWDPAHRYATAQEFAEDIESKLAHRAIRARPAGLLSRACLWSRRNPVVVAASAAIVVFAVAAFTVIQSLFAGTLLERAGRLATQGSPDEARRMLEQMPSRPWHWPGDVDNQCWIKILEVEGDLRGAAERAEMLPAEHRRRALDRLRRIVTTGEASGQLGCAEDLARCGAWWIALRILGEVVPYLDYVAAGGAETPPWLAGEVDKAFYTALLAFEAAQYHLSCVELSENATTSVRQKLRALAKALDDVMTPVRAQDAVSSDSDPVGWRLYAGLTEKFRFEDADAISSAGVMNSGLRREEARFLLAGIRHEALRALDHNAGNAALARALFLNAYQHLLDGYDGDMQREAGRWLWLLKSLAYSGEAIDLQGAVGRIPAPSAIAAADVDGDGRQELLVSSRTALHSITVPAWGQPTVRQCPMPEGLQCVRLAAGDLDGDGADEVIMYAARPGAPPYNLEAFRVIDGELSPYGEETHAYMGAVEPQNIAVADVCGDGAPEVILGLGPSNRQELERELHVIERPFLQNARDVTLPLLPGTRSDVLSVFVADCDGNPGPEIGCTTGPWQSGFDVRIWRRAGDQFVGPTRIGPYGSILWTFPLPLAGASSQEILFVKTSENLPNEKCIPDPPHMGVKDGLYVLRMPGQRLTSLDPPQAGTPGQQMLALSQSLPLDAQIQPRGESIKVANASLLQGEKKTIAAVAWDMSLTESRGSFIDLYIRESDDTQISRHRILWDEQPRSLSCHWLSLEKAAVEPPNAALVVLYRDPAAAERWMAGVWRFAAAPKRRLRDLVAPGLVIAYSGLRRYDEAADLGARLLQQDDMDGSARVDVALRQAEAASRACRLDALSEALRITTTAGEGPNGLAGECARLAAVERGLRGLSLSSPAAELSSPETRIAVAVETASDLMLDVTLEIREMPYANQLFIGLVKDGAAWADNGFGLWFQYRGGTGLYERRVDIKWGDKSTESPAVNLYKNLSLGCTYKFTLWRTSDGRVHVKRSGSDATFYEEMPSYDSNPELAMAAAADIAAPVPPGNYVFGIFGVKGGGEGEVKEETSLHDWQLDLRLSPTPE